MQAARLALFKSEIKNQTRLIDKIYAKIEERKENISQNPAYLESLAYQLHNLYSAFEDLFTLVAEFFENSIDDLTSYHSELLKRMSLTVEGIRPAIIDEEAYKLLDNLRAFRHFLGTLTRMNLILEKSR